MNPDEREFIKNNYGMIKGLVNGRLQYYLNRVVDAEQERREVYVLMVKELRGVLVIMETLLNTKDKKKGDKEYTGV